MGATPSEGGFWVKASASRYVRDFPPTFETLTQGRGGPGFCFDCLFRGRYPQNRPAGTRFGVIHMKARPPPTPLGPAPLPPPSPQGSTTPRLRVLVVDGYADAADSTALLLTLWGYDVRVARTGPEA